MNFEQYRPLALRTAKRFPDIQREVEHVALGLITEIGEFVTEVKRIVIYGKPMEPSMREHMIEEISDAEWYVPLALEVLNIDLLPEGEYPIAELERYGTDLTGLSLMLSAMAGSISLTVLLRETHENVYELRKTLTLIVATIHRVGAVLGISHEELRAYNIAKLRQRYPDKYSDVAAEARADKAGLPALVS
jgi:hypothetical protein